jgi:cytochrome c-type protein NapB
VIPHEVDVEINRDQRCNTCHEKGGFVPKFNAYTPVTPHPEYRNCMQCHVPSSEEDLFVETDWTSVKQPNIHRPALPGSPPPIPHTLQLRENCLSCHAGPAVPLEIRTTHPERRNCRQCHVPRETLSIFQREDPELIENKINK